VSHLRIAREAILAPKCLRSILGAMAEGAVVECTLALDDARHRHIELSTLDMAFAAQQLEQVLGPFSEGWYASGASAAPLLCARTDGLYILFNVAALDLSAAMGAARRAYLPTRTVERMVRAVLQVAEDDSECCDLPALLMALTLERLLLDAAAIDARVLREAVAAISLVGTQVLHAVSADYQLAVMSGAPRGSSLSAAGDGSSSLAGDQPRDSAPPAKKWVRSSMGLFVLKAAVAALRRVCAARSEAVVGTLRSDASFLDPLVALLSLFARGYRCSGAFLARISLTSSPPGTCMCCAPLSAGSLHFGPIPA